MRVFLFAMKSHLVEEMFVAMKMFDGIWRVANENLSCWKSFGASSLCELVVAPKFMLEDKKQARYCALNPSPTNFTSTGFRSAISAGTNGDF